MVCFRPFLEYLVTCADLSPKTIQKDVDNLWALGGEIIRDLNKNPPLRRKNIKQILLDVIDGDGGPLIYGVTSEQQQRSFDATCRKFSIPRSVPAKPVKLPTDSPDEAKTQG